MPLILAIETSTELASLALLDNDRLLTRESPSLQTHSQKMLPLLQGLLLEAGVRLDQCDAIAFGAGPGSFTGVRTACGIVQGLAFGADIAVVPVVTLLAMAESCRMQSGEKNVLAVLDARMGEVYWAQYRHEGDWHTVQEPRLSKPAEVAPLGQVCICGNGLIAHAEALRHLTASNRLPDVMPHASAVAALGRDAWLRGDVLGADGAQPLYLRDKVAFTTAERLERSRA
ncbi:MAG: tsaB [Herminiimonas sp.]|nr:tsaB [Herminiimonas sp.]